MTERGMSVVKDVPPAAEVGTVFVRNVVAGCVTPETQLTVPTCCGIIESTSPSPSVRIT